MAIKSYKEWVLARESEGDIGDTVSLPPPRRTLTGVSTLPTDGWADHGPNPPPDPEDEEDIFSNGPRPPRPEQLTERHPLLRLWQLMHMVDGHLDDRNNAGLAATGADGMIDYMAPEIGAAASPSPG